MSVFGSAGQADSRQGEIAHAPIDRRFHAGVGLRGLPGRGNGCRAGQGRSESAYPALGTARQFRRQRRRRGRWWHVTIAARGKQPLPGRGRRRRVRCPARGTRGGKRTGRLSHARRRARGAARHHRRGASGGRRAAPAIPTPRTFSVSISWWHSGRPTRKSPRPSIATAAVTSA